MLCTTTIMNKSDQDIITEYLSGNEIAFNELIQRYMTSVYTFTYGLTHSVQDAEDITQDTFVKAWKNIKKYDKKYTFKTWVLTIARNTTYDFFRKKKNIPFSAFDNTDGDNVLTAQLADEQPLALEISVLAEDKDILDTAIEQLPPVYKEVISLRYGQDLTFEEMSVVVKRPLNTVKSQVRRGLIALKEVLRAPK